MELLRELFFERGNAAENGVKLALVSLRVIDRLILDAGRAECRAGIDAATGAEDMLTKKDNGLAGERDSAKDAIVD